MTGESREQATTFVVPSDEGADGRLSPGSDPGEDGYGAPLSAPVKLVVWDLDETLWAGTLSEGPVALDPSTADLVRTLNDRGIVNSICSKNDPEDARAELRRLGLWEEFVFARIDWSPKGARVAQIIDDAQLRPENVLFIDDSPTNRGEVRHFSEGIQTAGPEIIDHLLSLPELAGKDDRGRTTSASTRSSSESWSIARQRAGPTRSSCGPATSVSPSSRTRSPSPNGCTSC